MKDKVIIGSRGSDLAMWQAHYAQSRLAEIGVTAEIQVIKTQGDRQQDVAFSQMEGKGFFTKEIEKALQQGEIDMAVHSHKDLGSQLPDGLIIAGVSDRADPHEYLLIHPQSVDPSRPLELKHRAVVGTSSPRRLVQMQAFRPDVSFASIRGNVTTRLNKLRDQKYDAILLAKAGIQRLGIATDDLHVYELSPHYLIPSPAQGVLAYQVREEDEEMKKIVNEINHHSTKELMGWEREVLRLFEAGCQMPLGVYCSKGDAGPQDIWVTKADDEAHLPVRARFTVTNGSISPRAIVDQVAHHKPRSVFISRYLEEDSIFKRLLEHHGYHVYHQSLIDFKPVKFSSIPATDWIFFSSKNAVRYFFDQNPVLANNVRFGAISNGSAKELARYGYHVAFNGAQTTVDNVAEAFAEQAAYQSVLFPQASNSLRSIQQKLPGTVHYHDLVVYDNMPKTDFDVPSCEVIVFTSPLNVSTYLKKYDPQPQQTIVVIGETTAVKLKEYGINNYRVAYQPDEAHLLDEVMAV